MGGETEIICKAKVYIADDYGDNHATMKCQLKNGHDGPHQEEFGLGKQKVKVIWSKDEGKHWSKR